ncbi:MAG: hypothetical protein ACFFD2_00960 [Promethearchaeota archaeon]
MKKKHVQLVILSFFIIGLIIQGFIPYTPTNKSERLQVSSNSPIESLIHNTLTGVGYGLNYMEYANRTDTSTLSLDYDTSTCASGSATTTLATNWEGHMMQVLVYELNVNRTYLDNYDFENTDTYWATKTVDEGDWVNNPTVYHETAPPDWPSSGAFTYLDGEYEKVPGGGPKPYYNYDEGDLAAYTQNITIQGGTVTWAGIELDWRVDMDKSTALLFHGYVKANATEIWNVNFGNLEDSEIGAWQHQDIISINSNPFSEGNLTIEIGLYCDGDMNYPSPEPNPTFRFDNIKIYVMSEILPSMVQLKMNSIDIIDDGIGKGSVTQIPGTYWQTSPLATFSWSTPPNLTTPNLPLTIDFKADANLFALKQENLLYEMTPGAYGAEYIITDGENTTWEMNALVATPDGYWNHYLNFTFPTDWNITGVYEPQDPLVNILYKTIGGGFGDGYIQINLTDITNSPAGYWRLTSESPNYITNVIITNTTIQMTDFRVGDTVRVNATVINAADGYANLTIYDPASVKWATQIIQPSSDQFSFLDVFLGGLNTSAGAYETIVWWDNRTSAGTTNASESGLKRAVFSLTHSTQLRSYDVSNVQTDTFSDVLYNETFILKAKYTDTDTGLGIEDATVQIEWIDNKNYTMVNLGGGYYLIDSLNTSKVAGVYPLTIYADKTYYDSATKQISVELAHHTNLIPNSTSVTVDWEENITIQVFYNDTDINAGIPGATVWIPDGWQAGYWTVSSVGGGYYDVTFATTWAIPDTIYDVDISADATNYQLKTRQVSILVRARSSDLSYDPPSAVPIDDAVNITINFVDGVNGTGISNNTNQLYFTVNSSLNGYHSIQEMSAGVFYLEVNTSAPAFTQPGIYSIILDANWGGTPYYANKSITIKLTLRTFTTSLTYDPPGNIPYGNNINVTVHYRIADAASVNDGAGIGGAQINITTPGYIYEINYIVIPHATIAGDYIITIYNNTLISIDTYTITIEASGLTYYANGSQLLNINIRKLYSSIIITPVSNIPYGNNVNISLAATYSDPLSQWYNGKPIIGLTSSNFSITGPHITNIYDVGNGNYIVEILNGTVLNLGTYNEYIAILEGGLFLSNNRTVSWTIRKLLSSISINPIADIPYGNGVTATIHVIYDDSISQWYKGRGIEGLNDANFTLSGHTYSITEIGNGDYTLTIENGTILEIKSYLIELNLNEGNIFQESDPTSVIFTVRNLYTELIANLVPAQPLYEDVIITVYYLVKDTASSYYNGKGIVGAHVNITGGTYTYGTDYTVSDQGNGEYQVTINSSKLGIIKSYTIGLNATNIANHTYAITSSTFDVRAISTSFIYTAPSPAPWGTNITIDLTFTVEDALSSQNGNPLDNADLITINETDLSFVGDWSDLGNGNYRVELNTTSFTIGTYWANITIYLTDYLNRSVLVQFIMRAHYTQVTYDIPDPMPWGKNTTITVYFEDIDLDYIRITSVYNVTVNESQGFIYSWTPSGNGYIIELDTTDTNIWSVGNYKIQVKISKYQYQNSSSLIIITMKTRDTDMYYETPEITPYKQNATIKIQYRDLKNSTDPVGINNNTNPQIPGLQNCAGNVSISVTVLNSTYGVISGATYWIYTMESVAGYGDGWYNITIDTESLGLTGRYYIDIVMKWLSLSLYYNQSIRIGFNVRNITALLEYQPPGSTPYTEGSYISVWFKYTDLDNSIPIDDATVEIYEVIDPFNQSLSPFTIALGNYSVDGTGIGDNDRGSGWYLVKIFMGSDKLNDFGSYKFSIRFNETNYDTRSLINISFAIRQGYTQFTSPYAPLSYVINGEVNITINYIDSETGLGIVNTTTGDYVLLNWTWYNLTYPDILAVYGWSATNGWILSGDEGSYPMGESGRYQILINFTSIPVGNRTILSLNISAGLTVQSQILNITFIVEPQTSIMGVTFPQPVVWGVNSTFNVTYQKIDGTGIPGTILNLWDVDYGKDWNDSYWSYRTLDSAIGLFEVTVNNTLYPPPSSGFLRIRVDASGGSYTARFMNVFLYVRPIDTQVTITPPSAAGWNTKTNITIQYYDTYNSVSINDSDITDLTNMIINVTNVLSTYWTLYNGPADGYYIIEINTSYWATLNAIGHTVYIDIMWEGTPYYKNWTGLTIGVPVRSRTTDLSYTPPIQIPYGENSTILFEWRDLEIIGGQGIDNSSGNIVFELRDWLNQAWNSSGFAWITDDGNGEYNLRINSTKLQNYGSYTFTAYFNWPGKPFYNNQSISFSITIRQINTIITYTIPAPIPYGNPFQITIQFNVSDTSSSIDGAYIAGAIINITSISNSSGPLSLFSYGNNYSVTDNGFGSYTITIFNSSLDIDSYSLDIKASRYNIEQIYRNASLSFSFLVRALTTMLTYTSPLPVPWGNELNISIFYTVNDPASLYWHNVGIDASSWILSNGSLWTEGIHYSISGSNGYYVVTIDNETVYGANIGTFLFNITANSDSTAFLSASFNNIPFKVRALTTALTYIPISSVPFGNNVTMQVSFNVSDPESFYYDGMGLTVNIWSLSNGTDWIEGTDYVTSGDNGVYILSIFNTIYSSIGTFNFNMVANASLTHYEVASSNNVPFTVRALKTALTYVPASSVPFGNNITMQIFFNVSDPESILYDGIGLTVDTWFLSNGTDWIEGTDFVINGISGVYTLTILTTVYSSIGTFNFNMQANTSFLHYKIASSNNVPFMIRALTTTITYIPAIPIPFGNNITIQVFFNVSDPESILYNGLGVEVSSFQLSNSSGDWTENTEYVVSGSGGVFDFTVLNIVYNTTGAHFFNIRVTPSDTIYSSAILNNLIFNIRVLTTTLSIIPASPVPFGNNVTGIRLYYNVSDPASILYNGFGVEVSSFQLSNSSGDWTENTEYVVSGSSGVFDFTVLNIVYNTIGTHSFDIQATPSSSIYASATFSNVPFTIRALITALSYIPTLPTPYGNNITIQVAINISDPASILYDKLGLDVDIWALENDSGTWSAGTEFIMSGGNGIYTLTILKEVYTAITSYSFDINAEFNNPIYQNASLIDIPFRIRALITAITYNPIITQPFGNNVSVEVFINVSDSVSIFDGLGLDVTWYLSNSTGVWSEGIDYIVSGSYGVYIFTILNSVYNDIGSFSFNILGDPTEPQYSNASYTGVPFTIRALLTAISWSPIETQPWGNPVNVTIFYNVSDPLSVLYDGLGLDVISWILENDTTIWSLGTDYIILGESGVFLIILDNETIADHIGSYTFDVTANSGDSRYQPASVAGIPFTIRSLLTRLTYTPIQNVPWGNNITITFMYNVSDEASLWYNNLGIGGAILTITLPTGWIYGTDYTSWGDNGAYTLDISNTTYPSIQNYVINIQAASANPVFATGRVLGFTYTIRALATVLTYEPVTPVPYGNPVNISYHIRVNDPESNWYHGQDVPTGEFDINITNPNNWEVGINWTFDDLNQIITIFNTTANSIGDYNFDLETIPQIFSKYSKASFSNIPFSVRPLNTFLTYPISAKNSWGTNATIGLLWQVIDSTSIYHHGNLISGGQLEVIDPATWMYWSDYISIDQNNGSYILNIDKDNVNDTKTYIIDVKISHLTLNYYSNTTYIGLPFSILQVVTSHTTVINNTYYLDAVGGWPWGDLVNIQVFYNDTDHGTLVPNSNMTIHGDSGTSYESGNFTINGVENIIGGSLTGLFLLVINSTVAENAVAYNFYIELSHPTGNYLNHTYIFTISFRKSVSQIILRNPDVFIPWGDNITIIFTYNNSEVTGFPGIANAIVDVSVNKPAATNFFMFYENSSMGPGTWIIQMNTTWANVTWNSQVEVTFTITAVAPKTIIAWSFHTAYITPLDSDLRAVDWDASTFLEQQSNFNVTVELRDRSHINGTEGNLIMNNSYWSQTGSQGQYDNITFIIITREGVFTNYTWYWGNIILSSPSLGRYKLTFYFNQTPDYPKIQELLDYLLLIEVRGDYLSSSQTQVTIDLQLMTHHTAMTFDWTYANTTITPDFNITQFTSFNNGSSYLYGTIIDIYLYWWDLDSADYNPGISTSFISTNWSDPLYYRVFNLYELNSQDEAYKGLFHIQIDTNLFGDVVGSYTLQINATLEAYQRIYLLTHGYITFEVAPVPVNITLVEPIESTPITAFVRLLVNFTNDLYGEPIIARIQDIDIPSISGPMGGIGKWATSVGIPGVIELYIDSNILGIGIHTVTVQLNKTNHEITYQNFTVVVRLINTTIIIDDPLDEHLGDNNLTGIFRENYTLRFFYTDDTETYSYGYTHVGRISLASYNISNWESVGGKATLMTDEASNGIYKFLIQTSANVGSYLPIIQANKTNFATAIYNINFTVIQAASEIGLVSPDGEVFQVWKFGSQKVEIQLLWISKGGSNELILGNVTYTIKNQDGSTISEGNFESTEDLGHYTATISTKNLKMKQQYIILINATPLDTNYAASSTELTAFIKPIWEHPLFIIAMVGIAAVAGVIAYRRIKWYLLPREIKAIESAKKNIKKGKMVEFPFRDIQNRDYMFGAMFAEAWLNIDMKPPKLVRPEIVLFASELSIIIRKRVTTTEAELMVNDMKAMSIEEAIDYLGDRKIPPDASRRLLKIIGLAEKEELAVTKFANALSEIKGVIIEVPQAEEIMKDLQMLSPSDADNYLEMMLIPPGDRKRLLKIARLKQITAAPKIIPEVKIEKKVKVKAKSKSVSELREELDKISDMSATEKEFLIEGLKKLPLEKQEEILKRMSKLKIGTVDTEAVPIEKKESKIPKKPKKPKGIKEPKKTIEEKLPQEEKPDEKETEENEESN